MANARIGSRRSASRLARGLAGPLALLAVLTLSCESGGEPPAPSPAATATASMAASATVATATPSPAATPEPTAATVATATPAATPSATSTLDATATPSPTPMTTPTPTPTPEAVTVSGPLLVFSEVIEVDRSRPPSGQTETRRVYIYDLSADRYWVAFSYLHTIRGSGLERSTVQVAGESLVVWTENEVRRVSLGGTMEQTLFEHDQISWLEVSPDGTNVAIMYGVDPSGDARLAAVLVVDIATGEELLDTGRRFDPISVGSSADLRQRWHGNGTALLVSEQRRPGLLRLDGTFEVLPEDWHVSVDLRFALRVGERVGSISLNPHHDRSVWASLDVLDIETGDVLWTVHAQDGGGLYQHLDYAGDSWWGPGLPKEPTWEDRRHVFFNELAPEPDWRVGHQPYLGALKVLDAVTGEVQPVTVEIEELLRGRARSSCGWTKYAAPSQCRIWYDGRVIREGADGWLGHLGIIEPSRDLEVRGISPMSVAVEPDPPLPPPREEMVGPLLLYEVYRPHPSTPRLAIAFDEGTGKSWTVHRRGHPYGCSPPQAAAGGFVTCNWSELSHVTVDGQTVPLDRSPEEFLVSPDGHKVAMRFWGGGRGPDGRYNPARTVVLEIPSGDEILRVVHEELPTSAGLPPARTYWTAYLEAWTPDSNAVLLGVVDDDSGYGGPTAGVVGTLDGALRQVPCVPDPYGDTSSALACLSPDARYVVLGRAQGSDEYTGGRWRSFDVIDFQTRIVVWSVETRSSLDEYHWEWASPTEFAWSSGAWPDVFRFDLQRLDREAERAEVSVLDVTTGEIEVMDSADYLARFHPPSRATTECPENPGLPCKILLDGEVIGEGRWPRIIGFVAVE